MVFDKMKRAPARCAAALAVSLALAASLAQAAGLGRLSVQSALGQPLRAEVEVTSVTRDEAASLTARLASQSAFRQANLEFNPALSALRFTLERRGDAGYVVRITSLAPVNEPFLDLLVELTWSTGRVLREYTVLLDPPALRQAAPVIPPVAASTPEPAIAPAPPVLAPPSPQPPVAEPRAPVAATPAPSVPAPVAAPVPRPVARTAEPMGSADGTYTVKSGDTLGKIALANKQTEVSLDQMLVALFRANPNAFIGDNMNLLMAGRTISIPGHADAAVIAPVDARREVVAHSADFAQYRSRLAQAATGAAPAATAAAPAHAAQGRVTTKVEDKAAPAKAGDQLKIAKADSPATATAAQKADEAVARERAVKEQQDRAAALARSNELASKALELQSKAGAQAQKAAEAKKAEAAKAPEPVKAAPPPVVAAAPAAAPTPEPAPVVEPTKAPEPVKAEVAPAPAPAPVEPARKAPAAPVPAPAAPGFIEGLLGDTNTLIAIGGIVALLAAFFGLNVYRRRKVESKEEFRATGEGMRANSLFGATGGQSVDTGATSTFNSSFIPAASQLDSNEVDPVAEADVYIAYGREEQAEDILKEALRLQPDRHPVRVKLLEIYSRRSDSASFNAVFEELRVRTGGLGEDWERALKLGRSMDPSNAAYAGALGSMEIALRGPTTELRLNPSTKSPRPATLGGLVAPPATFGAPAPTAPKREPAQDLGALASVGSAAAASSASRFGVDSRLQDTAMQADTRMTAETKMPVDSRLSAGNTTQTGPTTRFEATLSPETTPEAMRAGTLDPFGATTTGIDFGSLDFDLGATKLDVPRQEGQPAAPPAIGAFELPRDVMPPSVDLSFPSTEPLASFSTPTRSAMPDVDLSIPAAPTPSAAAYPNFSTPKASAAQSALEEALSRPTLLGEVGALPDEQAPRLTSNTDQATVPLIDFDLSGSDVELTGRRTETQAGSPLAGQMATKLDLARGYIDLGVKDGARELIEEVMREGTRDQRQAAVELLKQVEA